MCDTEFVPVIGNTCNVSDLTVNLTQARMSWERDSNEMRFKRLQHLLEKSNIYSKFLLTKMEQQQQEVRYATYV